MKKREFVFLRYLVASVIPFAAAWLAFSRPALGEAPFFVFFGAVIVSAWFGGLSPACLTAGISVLLLRQLFMHPLVGSLSNTDATEQVAVFALLSVASACLVAGLRSERDKARATTEHHQRVLECFVDGLIAFDAEKRVVLMDPVAERMLAEQDVIIVAPPAAPGSTAPLTCARSVIQSELSSAAPKPGTLQAA